MAQGVSLDDPDLDSRLSKSDTLEKIGFQASVTRGVQTVFKKDDDFVIWGPASVEIVDKEGDRISAEALGKALPQLLRRARLSLEHTDQIVGRILERFSTEESVEVEINGNRYNRSEFPTDILDLDDGSEPALYVAGEVYDDTQQSKRARERIQEGELTSYSISGEALVTRKKVDSGDVYDDILDLDLSAVTLCEEGMNQGAAYAKVEGELSDKELAGEATDEDVSKQDVPVLEHPTTQNVDAAGAGSADPQTATVSKNMSSNSSDEATVEDVLKRLPDDGELATKSDLENVQKDAVDAVQDSLPDGNLATVEAMKSIVEDEVATQIESALEREEDARKSVRQLYAEADTADEFEEAFKQEYGSAGADVDVPSESGEGSSPADSMQQDVDGPDQAGDSYPDAAASDDQNTTGGGDAPNQGNESMDDRGVSTTSDKSDSDQDVSKGDYEDDEEEDDEMEMQDEMAGGMGDDGPSMEPPHPEDYQTQEAWQADYEAWSSEYEEYATEEAEDLDEGEDGDGDGGDEKSADKADEDVDEKQDVEEKQPDDDAREPAAELADEYGMSTGEVLEVLDEEAGDEVEMEGGDYEDDEEDDEAEDDMMAVLEESLPSDVFEVVREYVGDGKIARDDARKIARALDDDSEDDSEEDLEKTVADVLQGGAEVQGGTAIPTDPNDSQVDKQYSDPDQGGDGGTGESPALSNFYG